MVYNGTTYTASAILKDTTKSVLGCDSVYTTNKIIVETIIPLSHTASLSDCQSIVFNGVTYTTSALVSDTLKTNGGCDSVYNITNITINAPVVNATTLNGCDSVVYNGATYTNSITLADTTKSFSGCDSLYKITNINVQHITPKSETNTIAGCNTLILNGNIYNTSTILHDTLRSIGGCDSVFATTNIIVQHITPVQTGTVLEGCGSIVYNGVTYTASAIISDTTRSIGGCDSLYNTTTINIVTPVTIINTMRGCNSIVFNGTTYTLSAMVRDTVKTIKGCDSLYLVTNLNIQNVTAVAANNQVKGCNSVVFNGVTYTAGAVIPDTLHTAFGCDSIYRTNYITVQAITPVANANVVTGCRIVTYKGVAYTASAILADTVKSSFGCDSIYNTTTITVNNFDLSLSASPNPVIIGNMVSLQTKSSLPYTVLEWSPKVLFANQAATSQSYKADSTRQITVLGISAQGCEDTATLLLKVNYLDQIFIPNTFTPNNDGRNDEFKVYGNNVQSAELRIFNQWGQMIYESKDQAKGWNGYYNGKLQPIGVYVYVAKITMNDNTVFNKKGSLNLVR